MPIAEAIRTAQLKGSWIRKMFEEGALLKERHGAAKVFDFSIGNPDIEPPPAFHDSLVRLATVDVKGSHGYMANIGFADVREAIAKKVSQDHQVKIDGSRVVMSVGAAGGLNVVLKAILNPGDEVIVSRPYFVEYGAYIANHGGVMRLVDTAPDFDLDPLAISQAITERTAAVLINSPHNPSGRVYPATTIMALAKVLGASAQRLGRAAYLIADEPYRELVYGGVKVPPILAYYDEAIIVTSYSKTLSLPGERIGYIALGPKLQEAETMMTALSYATRVLGFVNAPALMQRTVAELTKETVDIAIYERRLKAFRSVLDEAGIEYILPEGAFYLFCRVPPKADQSAGDDIAFVEELKKQLILAVPGSGFGQAGYFRLAYCVDERIIKAAGPAFKAAVTAWQS